MIYSPTAYSRWLEPFSVGLGLGSNGKSAPIVPIAVRGTPSQGNLSNATGVALPTGFQKGDLLVVVIYCTKVSPPGTPTGWTAQTPITGTTAGMYVYSKIAVGSDTFVSTNSIALGVVNTYALSNPQTGFDATASITGTASPMNAASGSANDSPDVLISCFGADGISPVIGTPSGSITATTQQTNTSVALVTGYETLALSGTWTARSATVSGTSEWEGGSFAFN